MLISLLKDIEWVSISLTAIQQVRILCVGKNAMDLMCLDGVEVTQSQNYESIAVQHSCITSAGWVLESAQDT